MRALIVGAGAVGQVYARCLAKGGAEVSYFVRPRHRDELLRGTMLYPLRHATRREGERFTPHAVLTTLEEVAAGRWDQVFLCVPSTAVDDAWMSSLAAALGDAVVVALSPGIASLACVEAHVPSARVVPGLIGMISYQAPIPGETVPEPGIAFHLPRRSPSAFAGPRARDVVAALKAGGCPAVVDDDIARSQAFSTAILMPNIAALEGAGWSLRELGRGPMLPLGARGAREALAVVAAVLGGKVPWLMRFVAQAWLLRIVWWLAPHFVPLPLEAYLAYHFGKTRPQTRELLLGYVAAAKDHGLATPALASLCDVVLREPVTTGEGAAKDSPPS